MMIHVLLAFLAATSSLVYSIPHCPGGQPAPKVTVTTTTTATATTRITTTVHHTITVTHHVPPSIFSFSTQVSKHSKPNQPTASFFTVTITAPPAPSQTNLLPPKGGSLVSFSSPSDFPSPKSTSTSDCDVSGDSDNGHTSSSNDIDGSEVGPHIQNGTDVSGGRSHNNSSYSTDNDNSTLLNGNSSRHGPLVANPNDNSDENSNDNDIQNERSHGIGPSDDISRTPMKLCCNSQGQADSLVITLMAHSLGLDLSNKTGIIGVGCTIIGEGSLRDAPECPHSLIECGSFSPLEGVGSRCSV